MLKILYKNGTIDKRIYSCRIKFKRLYTEIFILLISECWNYMLIIMFIIFFLGFSRFSTVNMCCSVNSINHPKKVI